MVPTRPVRPAAWFQGLQAHQPLALLGGDLLPSDLQQGRQLGLVMGRAQVLHDPAHAVLLDRDLHRRGPRGGPDLA